MSGPLDAAPDDRGIPIDRRSTPDPNRFLIPDSLLPDSSSESLETAGRTPVTPREAATVVLVRETGTPPEVLLLQRHGRSGFAAGAWVFPGGLIDEADRDPRLLGRLAGPTAVQWAERMGVVHPMVALGYITAAIREVWEETGLLLASSGRARYDEMTLDRAREAVLEGSAAFAELVLELDLSLLGDALVYLAHWITPEPEPRRYDTRFFLAPAAAALGGGGEGNVIRYHPPELAEARWIQPAAAVRGFEANELRMLPPTIQTLRRLQPFGSFSEMREAFTGANVPTILPRMRRVEDGIIIEIPEHYRDPGE